MNERDPELAGLLVREFERHLPVLEGRPIDEEAAWRAVQAVKGSAGLAGEDELFAALERIDRRVREGDGAALAEAAGLVRATAARLTAGPSAPPSTSWHVPPQDLPVGVISPRVRDTYAAEVRDRLARIDEALASDDDPLQVARTLFRHVHTLKGAGTSVGDEAMGWFCHGLEGRIKGSDESPALAAAAIAEVTRWRAVLAGLAEDPATTLSTLRSGRRPPSVAPSRPSTPPSSRWLDSDPPTDAIATIRVRAAHVDRLLERFDVVDQVREGIAARGQDARSAAEGARRLRASLLAALRLIGPPRPWGAPAAAIQRVERAAAEATAIGELLDAAASGLRGADSALRDDVAGARRELSVMRQTVAGRLFARLTTAVETESRRSGLSVIVRTLGAEETIDRRISEQLVEPCLQLVRNAVAHGIEPPSVRAAAGKPTNGTITLTARKLGGRLAVTIEDDGAGVDVADLRARAVASGAVATAVAETTDDDTLLSLLFTPGFSTRESSDLLAGRGVGLDIARSTIHRMGGILRLSSRAGEGYSARIEVPVETGLVPVLWVTAGDQELALPAASTRRVRKNEGADAVRVPHLLSCLDGKRRGPAPFALDLDVQDGGARKADPSVGVDAVGSTEELLVRPLGPMVASAGPYAGAIVRGDGSLRLAIDAWALAPRARVLARRSGLD
jgi:two-component system chemotaxis sensor kinase CheA